MTIHTAQLGFGGPTSEVQDDDPGGDVVLASARAVAVHLGRIGLRPRAGMAPAAHLSGGPQMILAELEADLLYEMATLCEALDLGDKLEAAQIMTAILTVFVEQARALLQGCATAGPVQ